MVRPPFFASSRAPGGECGGGVIKIAPSKKNQSQNLFHFFWPPSAPSRYVSPRFTPTHHHCSLSLARPPPGEAAGGRAKPGGGPQSCCRPSFIFACARVPPHLPPWRPPLGPRGLPVFVVYRTRLMRRKEGAKARGRGPRRGFAIDGAAPACFPPHPVAPPCPPPPPLPSPAMRHRQCRCAIGSFKVTKR